MVLNKSREEIIYELLLSLNQGDSGYYDERVGIAISQYNALIHKGVLPDEDEDEEE